MKKYLLIVLCYFGLAPDLWLFKSRIDNDNQVHVHILQGLAITFFLICTVLFSLVVQVIEYIYRINSPCNNPVFLYFDILITIPFIAWVIISIAIFLESMKETTSMIQKVINLVNNKFIRSFTIITCFGIRLFILLFIGVLIRANYLTRPHSGPSSVYMLYENIPQKIMVYNKPISINVPKWIFQVGLYPIAEISAAKWGDDSITIEPLTRNNLKDAFNNGRFVFIATHGGYTEGSIALSNDQKDDLLPEEIMKEGGVGKNLQLVYIAGCRAGSQENQWRESLAPANVILFNRITWEPEHAYWLWFEGPKAISNLK